MKLSAIFFNTSEKGFQKYFKNTFWLFAEKLTRVLVSLLVGVWVARFLGPTQYGVFNYAVSYVGIFIVLSTLGLDAIVVRELVKAEKSKSVILGTTFFLKLTGSAAALALVGVAIMLSNHNALENKLIFIIGSSSILHAFNTIDYHFQAQVKSKFVVKSQLIALLTSGLLKVILILIQAPLLYFAWVVLAESLVLAAGLLIYYQKEGHAFKTWQFDQNIAKELLRDSWPLILSGLFVSLFLKIDQIMVKNMMGEASAGNYAAAARLSETWFYIPMVICASLFPAIVSAKNRDEILYRERLQRLFDFLLYLSIAVAIGVSVFGHFIVNLLYGEAYQAAAEVLIIQFWAGLFVAFGLAAGNWLISENSQRLYLLLLLVGTGLNIGLNYLFMPWFDLAGVAWSTLIAFGFTAFIGNLLFSRSRPLFYLQLSAFNLWSSFKRIKEEAFSKFK